MKKVGIFLLLFLWVVGVVGSFGYALYYKEGYPIVLGVVIAAAFGVPTVKKLWKILDE
jgi:hypothetical protein